MLQGYDEVSRDDTQLSELWCEDRNKWYDVLGVDLADQTHSCGNMSLQVKRAVTHLLATRQGARQRAGHSPGAEELNRSRELVVSQRSFNIATLLTKPVLPVDLVYSTLLAPSLV